MLVLAVNIHLFNNIRVLKRAGYPLGLFINVIAVSLSLTHLVIHTPVTSSSPVDSPLSSSISLSLVHSRLKTYLFHKFFPL